MDGPDRPKVPDARTTKWDRPWPYGLPGSIQVAGTAAAPLLAGFSLTLVVLVVQQEKTIRWPSVALLFLLGGSICFVGAVQAAFWARQYQVTPSEVVEWCPDNTDERRRLIQRVHQRGARTWTSRFTRLYQIGIIALFVGVALALVPQGDASGVRVAAVVLAGLGAAMELMWIFSIWVLASEADWAIDDDPPLPMSEPSPKRLRDRLHVRLAEASAVHGMARLFIPVIRVPTPPPLLAEPPADPVASDDGRPRPV
jgi:MFS family permease